MLTPQDLQEVSFEKAKIGGYVMKSVDEFLEPLMDDYVTLYKENAVLKSKMRLLVERLEEYRANEAAMKEEMLPRQYKVFMSRLQKHFGRTGYFERRRGERLCSPADIVVIEKVLADLGLSHLAFDAYERHYNWNG